MTIRLSILDQSPVFPEETAADALNHTIRLAQQAEELGYYRFWVSEHHDSGFVAGSSPEVLLAYLAAQTTSIRLGSGGIMLQHYSPYKVAENFNLLATLAPGRIDLGIGRAPGGLPRSTQALQKGIAEPQSLNEKLVELDQYVHNTLSEDHPLAGLQAAPIPEQPASIYLLGTSVSSAELAAELGLPYVFAQFINSDPDTAEQALTLYRERFNESKGTKPEAILALSVIVADTDEQADTLAVAMKNIRITLADGKSLNLGSREQAEQFGKESGQEYTIVERDAEVTKGSKDSVRRKLLETQEAYGVNEFIVVTGIKDPEQRIRSYGLLKEAFSELSVQS